MNDLISREAVRDLMYHNQAPLDEYDLDSIPSVDAIPVVHGHWFYTGAEDFSWLQYKCSNCRHENGRDENYCPNCGAKMDKVIE